jgi:hypothetical protein
VVALAGAVAVLVLEPKVVAVTVVAAKQGVSGFA